MNERRPSRTTRIVAHGAISGQIAVGDNNRLVRGADVTAGELDQLRQAFAELRLLVQQSVPPERRGEAEEHVAELEDAVIAKEPDISTMEYVKKWFIRHAPALAGAVTSIFVDPIVGRLVAAGGDALVAEFNRKLGDGLGA